MPPQHRLDIDNRTITELKSVTLELVIKTEAIAVTGRSFFGKPIHKTVYGSEYCTAYWSLAIEVDETSGDDCAPQPQLTAPVDLSRFPARLEAISGLRLAEGEGLNIEAWYGNDAPELRNNVVTFGAWRGAKTIDLRWTADYDWGIRRPDVIPFVFEGPAVFTGIYMTVKNDEDAKTFLPQVFPNLDLSELDVAWGDEHLITHKDVAPDRRRWRDVRWVRRRG